MPKMKTHKGAAKRMSITGTGRVKRTKSNSNHFFSCRGERRKRNLRKAGYVSNGEEKTMKRLIPYK